MNPIANYPARGASRSLNPARGVLSAVAALVLAGLAGSPAAQAATVSAVSSRVGIEHSAVEKQGWDFKLTEWEKTEKLTLAEPARAESLLPYTSSIDARLTMVHEARAAGEIGSSRACAWARHCRARV